jgi:hypothetical protein
MWTCLLRIDSRRDVGAAAWPKKGDHGPSASVSA